MPRPPCRMLGQVVPRTFLHTAMDYHSFLQLLDEASFLDHLLALTQGLALAGAVPSPGQNLLDPLPAASTPQPSVLSLDPFDDGMDLMLMAIKEPAGPDTAENLSRQESMELMPRNQLALARVPETAHEEVPIKATTEGPTVARAGAYTGKNSTARPPPPFYTGIRPDRELAVGPADPHAKDMFLDYLYQLDWAGDTESDAERPAPASDPPEKSITSKILQGLDLEGLFSEQEDTTVYGEVGPQHKFGDFDLYFENKHKKQQVADKDYIQWEKLRRLAAGDSSPIPQFFAGISVYVNGNTSPTLATIHKMVILHGGVFLSHLQNKGAATHIVCDRLTPRKRHEYRNYKVVRAQWIADCVEQQQLLNWQRYRLIDDLAPKQKRLGFEAVGEDPLSKTGSGVKPAEPVSAEAPFAESTPPHNSLAYSSPNSPPSTPPPTTPSPATPSPAAPSPTTPPPQISQLGIAKPRQAFAQMDAKHPDFLQHFFANSRLHHLSTWKADLKSKFTRLVADQQRPVKDPTQLTVLHIDFDCFFATALALNHKHLNIKTDPIAVSHGGNSSDIASCNYVARKFGIRNGMWLKKGLERCPDLKVIDYDFESYEKRSHAFYTYLANSSALDLIVPVLIDEALVGTSAPNIDELCQTIRNDIFAATQCSVSVGAGANVLLAKLANRKAKPDGHFHLSGDVQSFLESTDVRDLPGFGRGFCLKLCDVLGVQEPILVRQVMHLLPLQLKDAFGEKTGLKFYDYCRGRDLTPVSLDLALSEALMGRKSVSVDVNYGIRFETFAQAETFLIRLAKELHTRLVDLRAAGSFLTLRLARRSPDAPINPPKFMGLGQCNFFSKLSSMGVATNDWGLLGSEMKALFRIMNIPPIELRGIAVTLSKLEDVDVVKRNKQQRLDFGPRKTPTGPKLPVLASQDMPFAERVSSTNAIDWEVFNQLPGDIQFELKQELLRRGIRVSGNSPQKRKPSDGKVFLQQTFPLQPYGEFKVRREVILPRKKAKKVSPQKPKPVYDDTVSYDEDVLLEIPSLVRKEFMADVQRQQDRKALRIVTTKTKIEQREQRENQIRAQVINETWVAAQPRLVKLNTFNGLDSAHEISKQLRAWVLATVNEDGPHADDIAMLRDYILDMVKHGQAVRSALLLRSIRQELAAQETISKLCLGVDSPLMALGIRQWKQQYRDLCRTVQALCNIDLD